MIPRIRRWERTVTVYRMHYVHLYSGGIGKASFAEDGNVMHQFKEGIVRDPFDGIT
mgnify:CR=1 FL=1